eukprot:CAMPEP_0170553430 /NCGR_PEP_ID=MMETSP0211-20121228/11249_1 /TAXON_ID=311385 /ORGANISM="Pseudokeronopsis sp., Strain OXSARD2" /LENGTH=112 /DNA_ID=CAMNT_0010861745 /DNA_START=202 /DNA_END=540 /DNA_ORIENTATION=-
MEPAEDSDITDKLGKVIEVVLVILVGDLDPRVTQKVLFNVSLGPVEGPKDKKIILDCLLALPGTVPHEHEDSLLLVELLHQLLSPPLLYLLILLFLYSAGDHVRVEQGCAGN